MKKLFKHKAFRISFYVVIALLGMLITFAYGTFKPNFLVKEKLKAKYESSLVAEWNSYGFIEPSIEYSTNLQFVKAVGRCIDFINLHLEPQKRIHRDIIIAMAVLETGYGTSRFAKEANNLFGIRTWEKSSPHLLPQGIDNWPGWGVRIFATKCDSVKEYVRLLNEHPAYKEFRQLRETMLVNNRPLDPIVLIKTLDKFSTTADYDKRVIRIINKVRKLEDTYASDKTIK